FAMLCREPYETPCGEPFGLIVGDYLVGARPVDDVGLLKVIARMGAAAHAPFVSNAHAGQFDLENFGQLRASRDLGNIFRQDCYYYWRTFRDSEDSRYVALTLPRVLG